jgi:hypothetical protein
MPSPPFLGNGVGAIAMQNVEIKVVLLRHLAFGHDDTPSRLRLFRLAGPGTGGPYSYSFSLFRYARCRRRTEVGLAVLAGTQRRHWARQRWHRRPPGDAPGARSGLKPLPENGAQCSRGSENGGVEGFGYGVNGCAAVWCMNIPPVGLCCMDPAWLRADG